MTPGVSRIRPRHAQRARLIERWHWLVLGSLGESDDGDDITAMVEQPAKVMRIGTMIKQLLEEVRAAPLDEAGRQRLREIHESSIKSWSRACRPSCARSSIGLTLPFGTGVPSGG